MKSSREITKSTCKSLLNFFAVMICFPCAVTVWLQEAIHPCRAEIFCAWGQFFSLVPGICGVYLRRAFYRMTLESCQSDVFIGFGTLFAHREVQIESNVYIGHYALIGSAILRKNALIGSRASLLSGGQLHFMDAEGNWTAADLSRVKQIEIGENAWLGEACVVMADVGQRAMVSAGAVVSATVPERVMVAGNPARFVKRLEPQSEALHATMHVEIE